MSKYLGGDSNYNKERVVLLYYMKYIMLGLQSNKSRVKKINALVGY